MNSEANSVFLQVGIQKWEREGNLTGIRGKYDSSMLIMGIDKTGAMIINVKTYCLIGFAFI